MPQLTHHGVLGMKWGVRKDRATQDRVLKKGSTQIQNISREIPRELRNKTPLYGSYTDTDNLNYAGTYADILTTWMGLKAYKNDFVVAKDVKIASDKKAAETFIQLYKKDPEGMAKGIAATVFDRSVFAIIGKSLHIPVEKMQTNKLMRKGETFMTSDKGIHLFNQSLVSDANAKLRKRYFESLLKQGYGAISDLNDRKNAFASEDPLIFLDPKKHLTLTKSTELTSKEVSAAVDKYQLLTKSAK